MIAMTPTRTPPPSQDLVVPSFKPTTAYKHSPYLGGQQRKRDVLLFFKGDMGQKREAHYSRGIRQRVYNASKEQGWKDKYNILVGGYEDAFGDYSEMLSRSRFCLVMPGAWGCWWGRWCCW